eukprot:5478815-Amphidinium_carterae.1
MKAERNATSKLASALAVRTSLAATMKLLTGEADSFRRLLSRGLWSALPSSRHGDHSPFPQDRNLPKKHTRSHARAHVIEYGRPL